MCDRLPELRGALRDVARSFDASLLSGAEALAAQRHAQAIEKMAATVKGLAAARVAETGEWAKQGDRSPAHHLARTSGTGVKAAEDALTLADRLSSQPAVSAAARAGELSPVQAAVVSDAAAADPSSEERLVDEAQRLSLRELQEECGRTKARVIDLEERRRRNHARRGLRTCTDSEGMSHLHASDNPEVIARLRAAIDPVADKLFAAARAEGRRERPDVYAMDALVELLCGGAVAAASPKGGDAKVIARVDLETLLRGYPIEDEVCELVGYGPVAPSAIADMLAGGAFLAGLVAKGVTPIGTVHLGRHPTANQTTYLQWLFTGCGAKGCARVGHLESDHREDWAATHATAGDGLDRLCKFHHHLKTAEGWALVEGEGKREFVPPDDPRHPRNVAKAKPRPAA